MSPLALLLTEREREALKEIARVCSDRIRPLSRTNVSGTLAGKLAKLDVIIMRRGDLDKARLVRMSLLGRKVLQEILDAEKPEIS